MTRAPSSFPIPEQTWHGQRIFPGLRVRALYEQGTHQATPNLYLPWKLGRF